MGTTVERTVSSSANCLCSPLLRCTFAPLLRRVGSPALQSAAQAVMPHEGPLHLRPKPNARSLIICSEAWRAFRSGERTRWTAGGRVAARGPRSPAGTQHQVRRATPEPNTRSLICSEGQQAFRTNTSWCSCGFVWYEDEALHSCLNLVHLPSNRMLVLQGIDSAWAAYCCGQVTMPLGLERNLSY